MVPSETQAHLFAFQVVPILETVEEVAELDKGVLVQQNVWQDFHQYVSSALGLVHYYDMRKKKLG